MNHIALKQNIQHLPMIIGGGNEEEEAPKFEVYRHIDDADVYHVNTSSFFPQIKDESIVNRRSYSIGEIYHPYLMFGMPNIGGTIKLHIDTRFEGYYVLWAGAKLDEWASGPSERFWDVVTWTPKMPKDSIKRASYRLAKALFLQIDGVEDGNWKTDLFQNENWEEEWWGSCMLMDILREIRD